MTKSLNERITKSRLLLQNPYAYLNEHGGYSALVDAEKYSEASTQEITDSRQLLQNQYAYLDDSGGFSALSKNGSVRNSRNKERYTFDEIELQARNLQKALWENKDQIWLKVPSNPIDMLDPVEALKFIGYEYELSETLGQFRSNGKLMEVAGTIDKHLKRVRISRQFTQNIRSFTAAHELGHAILHQPTGLHRDKPLDGAANSRDQIEIQADKFATFFLMPRKLVNTNFKKVFLTEKFSLNEATAFALGYSDFEALITKCKTLRDLSRILAATERYNGHQFVSLANQFKVSTEAMAIRLEELELLEI